MPPTIFTGARCGRADYRCGGRCGDRCCSWLLLAHVRIVPPNWFAGGIWVAPLPFICPLRSARALPPISRDTGGIIVYIAGRCPTDIDDRLRCRCRLTMITMCRSHRQSTADTALESATAPRMISSLQPLIGTVGGNQISPTFDHRLTYRADHRRCTCCIATGADCNEVGDRMWVSCETWM